MSRPVDTHVPANTNAPECGQDNVYRYTGRNGYEFFIDENANGVVDLGTDKYTHYTTSDYSCPTTDVRYLNPLTTEGRLIYGRITATFAQGVRFADLPSAIFATEAIQNSESYIESFNEQANPYLGQDKNSLLKYRASLALSAAGSTTIDVAAFRETALNDLVLGLFRSENTTLDEAFYTTYKEVSGLTEDSKVLAAVQERATSLQTQILPLAVAKIKDRFDVAYQHSQAQFEDVEYQSLFDSYEQILGAQAMPAVYSAVSVELFSLALSKIRRSQSWTQEAPSSRSMSENFIFAGTRDFGTSGRHQSGGRAHEFAGVTYAQTRSASSTVRYVLAAKKFADKHRVSLSASSQRVIAEALSVAETIPDNEIPVVNSELIQFLKTFNVKPAYLARCEEAADLHRLSTELDRVSTLVTNQGSLEAVTHLYQVEVIPTKNPATKAQVISIFQTFLEGKISSLGQQIETDFASGQLANMDANTQLKSEYEAFLAEIRTTRN